MNHLHIYVCVHVYRGPPSPSCVPLNVFFRWARPRTAWTYVYIYIYMSVCVYMCIGVNPRPRCITRVKDALCA